MSSFVSGSNPTSSTICLMRRTMESPIRAWVWMTTKLRAVKRILGGLIGGVAPPHAGPGRARDPVLVGQVDLPGVLDGDDLCARADEEGRAVQGRRLPGRRPAAEDRKGGVWGEGV